MKCLQSSFECNSIVRLRCRAPLEGSTVRLVGLPITGLSLHYVSQLVVIVQGRSRDMTAGLEGLDVGSAGQNYLWYRLGYITSSHIQRLSPENSVGLHCKRLQTVGEKRCWREAQWRPLSSQNVS